MNQAAARLLATLPACALILCAVSLPRTSPAQPIAEACPKPALAPVVTEAPNRENAPITVMAQAFDASKTARGQASGHVELFRADQYLATELLEFSPADQTITSPGPMIYRDAQVEVEATEATLGLRSETGQFDDVAFGLVGSTAHGGAERISIIDRDRSTLTQSWFTTCPGDEGGWQLSASEIELDQAEGLAVAKGAKLRLGKVPVLYLPWMSFPIDDRRKSGFLYPTIGTSNDNGVEFGIPYYWNIAPQQDATVTPRYFTDRGFVLTGQYRLLTGRTLSSLDFDYLPDDKETKEDRWHYQVRSDAEFSARWRGGALFERVSDDEYFQDFGGGLRTTSRQYLHSIVDVTGAGRYWWLSILADAFQVIDDSVNRPQEPYKRLPRIGFLLDRPLGRGGLQAGLNSELVYFDRDEGVTGARLDLYPRLEWNTNRYWGFFRASAGYRYTTYDLNRGLLPGDESPDRGTEIFSLDSGLFFERDLENGDTQTLEPRLFYLYVPFEEQNDLPDFDTGELTFGFAQLFHYNRFTGADRQSDANQVTIAASTRRISNTSGRELWNLNFGQIFYFDPPVVRLDEEMPLDEDTSPFLAELNWHPLDRFNVQLGIQWSWEESRLDVGTFGIDHTARNGSRVGFEYRFRRDRLDQFDLRYLWPVNERWRMFGRVKYSLDDSELLEAALGVEYESCCWSLRVMARRYLKDRRGGTRDALYMELRLKGLGSFGRDAPSLFRDIGY